MGLMSRFSISVATRRSSLGRSVAPRRSGLAREKC